MRGRERCKFNYYTQTYIGKFMETCIFSPYMVVSTFEEEKGLFVCGDFFLGRKENAL